MLDVLLRYDTTINNLKHLKHVIDCISMCVLVLIGWLQLDSHEGEVYASEVKHGYLNGGYGESVVEATIKSERLRTHYPPAKIPQRRQLVRNSFCLSLSHFPRRQVTFMNLNCQPSFPCMPPLRPLFVSVLSPFPGPQ